ncbi:unnamed protein product, partial [Trichobilharzia regenti]
ASSGGGGVGSGIADVASAAFAAASAALSSVSGVASSSSGISNDMAINGEKPNFALFVRLKRLIIVIVNHYFHLLVSLRQYFVLNK